MKQTVARSQNHLAGHKRLWDNLLFECNRNNNRRMAMLSTVVRQLAQVPAAADGAQQIRSYQHSHLACAQIRQRGLPRADQFALAPLGLEIDVRLAAQAGIGYEASLQKPVDAANWYASQHSITRADRHPSQATQTALQQPA
jgi:hypothetical protein